MNAKAPTPGRVPLLNEVVLLNAGCCVSALGYLSVYFKRTVRILPPIRCYAATAIEALARVGIVREITGRSRDRIFAYDGYISILNEEASPWNRDRPDDDERLRRQPTVISD